jgi:hypothetical protein
MRVPKEYPHKLLRTVEERVTGVIEATSAARIRAFWESSVRTKLVTGGGK